MNREEALLQAIDQMRGELPALLRDGLPQFEAQLNEYLQQLEMDRERAPIVHALILDLFSRYPDAHRRLVEVMAELGSAEWPEVRAVASRFPHSQITRYSDVTLPRETEVGVRIALLVRVTVEAVSPEAKKLEIQPGEVTVIARPDGLELLGSNLRRLRVPPAADSDPVHFELVGRRLGSASVTVDFFQEERYLCSVTVETYVKAAGEIIRANPAATRGTLHLGEAWEAPDLMIRINESRDADGLPRYRFELTSHKLELFYQDAGEVGLPLESKLWVDEQMKTLTQMARNLSDTADRVLASFGGDLYGRLCPATMQELYWSHLHEREDIQTVLLVSSEPWIPWEMLKPWRKVGDDIVEAPHWCERFAMSRWLNGQPPPLTLPRGEVAVIAPRDASISTEDEVDMLRRIGLCVKRVPARLALMLEFFESDGAPSLHVVSHGIFNLRDSDQSELWLEMARPPDEDSREKQYPRLLNGRCLQFGKAKPLVFLNACNCGRSDFTYWGLGGWAKAFVSRAGCSAFVGPFWEVEDERALKFAEAFYRELLQGKSISEAARTARMNLKQTDNPTWLAYCIYGHPKATLARRRS